MLLNESRTGYVRYTTPIQALFLKRKLVFEVLVKPTIVAIIT